MFEFVLCSQLGGCLYGCLVFGIEMSFFTQREEGYVTAKPCVKLIMFILNSTDRNLLELYSTDRLEQKTTLKTQPIRVYLHF